MRHLTILSLLITTAIIFKGCQEKMKRSDDSTPPNQRTDTTGNPRVDQNPDITPEKTQPDAEQFNRVDYEGYSTIRFLKTNDPQKKRRVGIFLIFSVDKEITFFSADIESAGKTVDESFKDCEIENYYWGGDYFEKELASDELIRDELQRLGQEHSLDKSDLVLKVDGTNCQLLNKLGQPDVQLKLGVFIGDQRTDVRF